MTLLAQQTDPNYDPRQELIPRAPEIEGDLPQGEVQPNPFDLSDSFGSLFSGDWFSALLLSLGGVGAALAVIWSVYTVFAYIFSAICIILFIIATIRMAKYGALLEERIRAEETKWNQMYRNQDRPSRLDDMLMHIASANPNDWKLAIIEADIILDKVLIERGYQGDGLGARLRQITPSQLASINDAWEAHKVRNQIAHEGADFILTKGLAEDTIARYRRVFTELVVD